MMYDFLGRRFGEFMVPFPFVLFAFRYERSFFLGEPMAIFDIESNGYYFKITSKRNARFPCNEQKISGAMQRYSNSILGMNTGISHPRFIQ